MQIITKVDRTLMVQLKEQSKAVLSTRVKARDELNFSKTSTFGPKKNVHPTKSKVTHKLQTHIDLLGKARIKQIEKTHAADASCDSERKKEYKS